MKTTCGHQYQQAIAITLEHNVDAFSAGFLVGQIQKVFIGACQGCMTKDVSLLALAERLCREVYHGLRAEIARTSGHADELWVHRLPGELLFCRMAPDSPEWHLARAAICGIAPDQIDLYFHRRSQDHHDPATCPMCRSPNPAPH